MLGRGSLEVGSGARGGWAGSGARRLLALPRHPPSGRPELGGHPSLDRRALTDAWAPSADNAPILGRSAREKVEEKTQFRLNSGEFTG